ncbi:thioredoxin-domain-containing protein [Terfezia boudieri ATCC MYA-4762]|uniref:protein disulfide-isomerase n=1 Tax=Terfezia boudieri ATCC MYA-4762 TaxID=1051890 RepID=A0A3N4LAE7_9PEZI|nr:thioredoxin-domain-containing protein [Terfezia boudieri ATCC MYA-4762]
MVQIPKLTLAALLLAGPASALYTKSGPVQLLDQKSFEKEILQSDSAAIVEFFAPWCGHCKGLAPHYEKAAKNLKGIAKVAAVDCDDEKNKPLCASQGVQGYPTLKIIKPSSKKGKPIVEDYQGPRTAKGIVDAVVDRIPNHVTRLTSGKVNDWLTKNNGTTKGVLFTPRGTTSALYRALAIEFLGRAEFAQIRDKEEDAVKLFGVEKFPTFIVLPGGDAPGRVYDGAMKIDALTKFVRSIAPAKKEGPKESKKESKRTEKEDKRETKEEKERIKRERGEEKERVKRETREEKVKREMRKEKEKKQTTEDAPPSPVLEEISKVALVIPELADGATLASTCFSPKSKTCVLAFVPPSTVDPSEDPALSGLNAANEKVSATTKTFTFFKISSSSTHGKALAEALELTIGSEKPTVIAVNGHRRWYRVFSGNNDAEGLLAWLDAITMGEVKKQKLPKGLFQEKEKVEVPPPVESPAEEVPPPPMEETKLTMVEHEEL